MYFISILVISSIELLVGLGMSEFLYGIESLLDVFCKHYHEDV